MSAFTSTPALALHNATPWPTEAHFDPDQSVRQVESQFLSLVHRWGDSFGCIDEYTQDHSERVADLACQLALDAGLDEAITLWFRVGALLHDVGKITVPSSVLNKVEILTPQDVAILRHHAAAGEALVSDVNFPWDIRPMIRHHHERWDGAGYPDGLAGEEIPVSARVLCIADVFDALTSRRIYRPPYSVDAALRIMMSERGGAFDPWLLDVFVERTIPVILGVEEPSKAVAEDARMIA